MQSFSLCRSHLWGESCNSTKVVRKKAQALAPFKQSVQPPPDEPSQAVPEVDEVFTFVALKVRQIRIWIVLCRQTQQIVSFFTGDGAMESCKRLWRKLPYAYLKRKSFSNCWKVYNCLPDATHRKVEKQTGETAHVERLNNTIRQRFSRLVRRALSFSKRKYMLNIHFKLWAYHYNLSLA